jgi:hypothetical protein
MSVLKIHILAFLRRACFGSQNENESGNEKKNPKRVGSSGKISDLCLRGARTEIVREVSQTFSQRSRKLQRPHFSIFPIHYSFIILTSYSAYNYINFLRVTESLVEIN